MCVFQYSTKAMNGLILECVFMDLALHACAVMSHEGAIPKLLESWNDELVQKCLGMLKH